MSIDVCRLRQWPFAVRLLDIDLRLLEGEGAYEPTHSLGVRCHYIVSDLPIAGLEVKSSRGKSRIQVIELWY